MERRVFCLVGASLSLTIAALAFAADSGVPFAELKGKSLSLPVPGKTVLYRATTHVPEDVSQAFAVGKDLFAVGADLLFQSTDGGKEWKKLDPPGGKYLERRHRTHSTFWPSPSVLGNSLYLFSADALFKYSNGTWTPVPVPPLDSTIADFATAEPDTFVILTFGSVFIKKGTAQWNTVSLDDLSTKLSACKYGRRRCFRRRCLRSRHQHLSFAPSAP